jgi:hypothetical protein
MDDCYLKASETQSSVECTDYENFNRFLEALNSNNPPRIYVWGNTVEGAAHSKVLNAAFVEGDVVHVFQTHGDGSPVSEALMQHYLKRLEESKSPIVDACVSLVEGRISHFFENSDAWFDAVREINEAVREMDSYITVFFRYENNACSFLLDIGGHTLRTSSGDDEVSVALARSLLSYNIEVRQDFGENPNSENLNR